MTIVTPSQWLADLVKESYLKEYDIKVINNGIDLNVFRPTKGDFEERMSNILGGYKYIILGVAFDWDERKGLDVFIKLASLLNEDYQIVLVGVKPVKSMAFFKVTPFPLRAGISSIFDVIKSLTPMTQSQWRHK